MVDEPCRSVDDYARREMKLTIRATKGPAAAPDMPWDA
jgi:hypothetical protein